MKLQHGCLSWMNNVPRKRTEKYREEQRNPRRAGLVRGWTESINCTKTLIKVGEPQIALRKQPKKKGLRHTKGKKSFLTRVDCKNVWGKPSNNFFSPEAGNLWKDKQGQLQFVRVVRGKRYSSEQRHKEKTTSKQLLWEVKLGKSVFC